MIDILSNDPHPTTRVQPSLWLSPIYETQGLSQVSIHMGVVSSLIRNCHLDS